MIKNVATNFSNNVVADSSMPHTAWIGSYSGPVFDMSFSHNVAWNSTGYCDGGGWPGVVMQPPGPGSPIGIGTGFLSGNYWLDNGYACGFRGACAGDPKQAAFYNRTGAGIGGVFVNGSTTCYHTGAGSYPDYGCNHYPNCELPPSSCRLPVCVRVCVYLSLSLVGYLSLVLSDSLRPSRQLARPHEQLPPDAGADGGAGRQHDRP